MSITHASNTVLNPTIIAQEALMLVTNNLVMGKLVHRQYKNEFKKIGTQLTIRKPVKGVVTKARAMTKTDLTEYKEVLTVATQAHAAWGFNSVELTMTIEDYSKRYIAPQAEQLANTIDFDLTALYSDIGQQVGTPGTVPATYAILGAAQQKLDEAAAPKGGRVAVVNPAAKWALADGLKGTFAAVPANAIHTQGELGSVAGLNIHSDQNIRNHTTGTFTTAATPLVDTTNSADDVAINSDGWSASSNTIKPGDVFTVASVYSVNPMNGQTTGNLFQFCYIDTEDAFEDKDTLTSSSSDIDTITVMESNGPGMQTSGPYKNMDAFPQDGAIMTFTGTEGTAYAQNLVFHPNAFALVTMPLAMPAGVWGARVTDKQMGISIRVIKDYNILEDEEIIRLDILYGVRTLYPELACRITA